MRTVRRRLTDGLGQPLCMVRIHPPAPVVSPTSLMSLARRGSRTYRARALLSTRVATLDIWLHSLAQLFQQESPLQSHLHDRAVEAQPPNPGFLVRGFDFVQAALELNAFAVVCFFDAGGERRACCAFAWDWNGALVWRIRGSRWSATYGLAALSRCWECFEW